MTAIRALLIWGLMVLPFGVIAAGADSPPSRDEEPADPQWTRALSLVRDGHYERAIPELLAIVRADDSNADAYNLLGFSHRKTGQLDAALKYYDKALAIDPGHRGAHEYIGEAFLESGDLEAARRHLAALDRDCPFGCSEHDRLEVAIERYLERRR